MSNDEFSSVEWLVEQIKKDINLRLRGFDIDKALEQAKEMHKQEMIKFGCLLTQAPQHIIEEAYNETYGGNEQ